MNGRDLLAEFEALGVQLWEDGGQLRFRAPAGVMTEAIRARVRRHREELITYLRSERALAVVSAPLERYDPFPLTDMQASYLLGRRDVFRYGGVGCHGYGELTYDELDPVRVKAAWRKLVARHDMLRAIVDVSGYQRVLPTVPVVAVPVTDLRGQSTQQVATARAQLRSAMDHRVYDPATWPLFELRVSVADADAIIHLSIDFMLADFISIQILLDEFHLLYEHIDRELLPLSLTFRDYLLAERALRDGPRYAADRDYWWDRLDSLPAAPELPVMVAAGNAPPRFFRHARTIDTSLWNRLKDRAGRHGVSPSVAVLTAYAEVIARWSRSPRFTLNLTLLNRLPLHPDVNGVVGDFTHTSLLAVDAVAGQDLASRARESQAQLWADMDHRLVSGVEVMRELVRRRGADAALMPVVFTSAIGAGNATARPRAAMTGRHTWGISQTPQVFIDCQNIERNGTLATNWDVREGIFPATVIETMFAAFVDLLGRMAQDDTAWSGSEAVPLPMEQAAVRAEANRSAGPLPGSLLHDGFLARSAADPERTAILCPTGAFTYGELARAAAKVAGILVDGGLAMGGRVAVVMDRGWEQVAAVLGILMAGGAYVPVDSSQPLARRQQMLELSEASCVLTQSWLPAAADQGGLAVIAVDSLAPECVVPVSRRAGPDDVAYIMFTSGSTGSPKGVAISHRGAVNTIDDVNRRWGVTAGDRCLCLASLGFDLSVYDIFGVLAAGGAIVIPPHERRKDPSCWAGLIREHGVTVWNSVPAQAQMLVSYLQAAPEQVLSSLRLALLSGDWIPIGLPDQLRSLIPGLQVVSLGGATEASIWSISYPIGNVDPAWASIPYGRPLANQTCHVLDGNLRPCPDWVTGHLFIGGAGLALEYVGDPAQTAERFIAHPATGERLYSTGDLGRYLPTGDIEILGREDSQVKIRGHRIELAEIEAALAAHPLVSAAAVVAAGDQQPGLELAAFVEPIRRHDDADDLSAGWAEHLCRAAEAAGAVATSRVDAETYLRYMRSLDELAIAAMRRALRTLNLPTTQPPSGGAVQANADLVAAGVDRHHHRLVRRWLCALASAPESKHADERDAQVNRVREVAAQVGDPLSLIDYLTSSMDRLPSLLRGEEDPSRLLFPQGRLEISAGLYETTLFNQWAHRVTGEAVRQVALLCGADRPLRILEVGAGAGATTAAVLTALDGCAAELWYTDLSRFFLNHGQRRFGNHSFIRYQVFDLDTDPLSQGLRPNSFDLVIAGDVLHATRDVSRSLAGLRQLLVPGGWLVMVEMTRDHYQMMTSIELLVRLDDETCDFADRRRGTNRTFLSRAEWHEVLAEAGARVVAVLPRDDQLIEELGSTVWVCRFKQEVAPLAVENVIDTVRLRLPGYMVPGSISVLDKLPLTDNGKIDRNRLRALIGHRRQHEDWAGAGEPPTGLEVTIARLWSDVLGVERVPRERDFFEIGGDSLLAAQLAGRIAQEVHEAGGVFFDEVLRLVLEEPTVARFCRGLDQLRGSHEIGSPQAPAGETIAAAPGSPAPPLPTGVLDLGGWPDAPPVFLVPDGTGSLSSPIPLPGITRGKRLLGFAPAHVLAAAELPPEIVLDRITGPWVDILSKSSRPVHLLGRGLGGLLCVELARRLLERDVEVMEVTVVASAPLPWTIADPILVEYLFAQELGAELEAAGLPHPDDVAGAVAEVAEASACHISADAVAALGGKHSGLAERWRQLQGTDVAARLSAIMRAVPRSADDREAAVEPSTRLAAFNAVLDGLGRSKTRYAGDLRVVVPSENLSLWSLWPGPADALIAAWERVCLGEIIKIQLA